MGAEDNATAVRRWIECYNDRDAQAEAAARTPGFLAHVPGAPGPLDGDAWTAFVGGFAVAFPDLHLTVEDTLADEEKVAARVTFRGTHQGDFQGIPPTGKQVTFTAIEYNRMEDGKIAEHWVELDLLGLMQQLGAIPAPGPTGN